MFARNLGVLEIRSATAIVHRERKERGDHVGREWLADGPENGSPEEVINSTCMPEEGIAPDPRIQGELDRLPFSPMRAEENRIVARFECTPRREMTNID